MTRDEAYQILTGLVKNQNLIKHHLAAEAAMKALYKRLTPKQDPKEEEEWGIVGLLHDAVTRAKKFSKITILYGENARGKTTLATIFSSLAKNDPSIISVRETLDGTQTPEVELRINNTNHIYQNGNWNQGCSNIIIFDSFNIIIFQKNKNH